MFFDPWVHPFLLLRRLSSECCIRLRELLDKNSNTVLSTSTVIGIVSIVLLQTSPLPLSENPPSMKLATPLRGNTQSAKRLVTHFCVVLFLLQSLAGRALGASETNGEDFQKAELGRASADELIELSVSMGALPGATESFERGSRKLCIVRDAPKIPVFWTTELKRFDRYGFAERATGDYHDAVRLRDKASMFASINSYLAENPRAKLCIYVHGCCQDFPSAFSAASELARTSGMPVLLYSWAASPYKVVGPVTAYASHAGYCENEAACEVSQSEFRDFLHDFDINNSVPARTILIAHSMGNRLLNSQMQSRALITPTQKKYKALVFACADLPVRAFTKNKRTITSNARKTFVLNNDKDTALNVSAKIHNGNRLGAAHSEINLVKGDGVDVIDIEEQQGTDHSMPFKIISNLFK